MNLFIKSILLLIFIFLSGCENKEYVKDFKIEGIAVGESLLDYFSKEDILSLTRTKDIMGNPIDLTDRVYIDAQFPNYIRLNRRKFKKLIKFDLNNYLDFYVKKIKKLLKKN